MLALAAKTKAKVIHITPNATKMGQKATIPVLSLRIEFTTSNKELDQLSPGLREFLFTKASTAPEAVKARQQPLDGVEAVSDLPSLSVAAQRLGTFEWGGEQTGCTMVIDRGLGDEASNILLAACESKKLQVTPQEGGSVKWRYTINTSAAEELDNDTHGIVCKLKKREIWFTLQGPKVDQIELPQGNTVTPIKALKNSVEGDKKDDPASPFRTSAHKDKPGSGKAAH